MFSIAKHTKSVNCRLTEENRCTFACLGEKSVSFVIALQRLDKFSFPCPWSILTIKQKTFSFEKVPISGAYRIRTGDIYNANVARYRIISISSPNTRLRGLRCANWNLLAAIDLYCFTDKRRCTIGVLIDVVLKTLICNIHLTETC